jgi:hypothetical protein
MGLDTFEIVLSCEKAFGVRLTDASLARAERVGDLFELICGELRIPSGGSLSEPQMADVIPPRSTLGTQWSRDTVWTQVVQICSRQLQMSPDEIAYSSSFKDDLRAD